MPLKTFSKKVSEMCQIVGVDIKVPRLSGNQRHRANATPAVQDNSQIAEAYFRANVFYPFLDFLITELNDRFLCHKTNAFALQCLVPKFTQKSELIDIQPAIALYQNVLSGTASDIEAEFALWRSKCISGNVLIDNAFDAFDYCTPFYPNIKFLLKILTTLPVTTASAERTFSMLRRLKTWLRSTMNDDRLSNLALLSVAPDININPDKVIENFLKQNRRRLV